ncbi:hypothetical protein [Pedobacter gandavensis]|uniref:Uncharacterized protein n=1 Tax=Pedobacter gandavensis TaxID=2679963 RepID=A0ABR6F2H3_9SPHI|nr:hypothetical protein [Pedobacter gandavensis]MBB2151705.1 hypothetical protein [Pedobacter gandavensis]
MKWVANIIIAVVSLIIAWQLMPNETFLHLFYFLLAAFVAFWVIRVILVLLHIDVDPFED